MAGRTLAVARADFHNARRSALVVGVVGVLALLTAVVVALPGLFTEVDADLAFRVLGQAVGLLVPVVALVAGYLSVAGERESGTLRVLLSLPPSRRAVVAGKWLSRTALVLAAVTLAFLVGVAASLAVYGTVPLGVAAQTGALTCLLGGAFVGIAVGLSAALASRARAVAAAVAVFVVSVVLWDAVVFGLRVLLKIPPGGGQPAWFRLLSVAPPSAAFGRLSNLVLGSLGGPVAPGGPLLSAPAMTLLLLAWAVVPPALGYLRFARADLG